MKIRAIHYLTAITILIIMCLYVYMYIECANTIDLKKRIATKESSDSEAKATGNCNTGVAERFIERRIKIEKKCASSNLTQRNVAFVSGHTPAELTVCVVPKAACTIWFRLFSYLANKNSSKRPITSYTKYSTHYPSYNSMKTYKRYIFNKTDMDFISTSIRAMTVRDPYTRLWSAYIDKFVLLDFWRIRGTKIITKFRNNAKNLSKECGNDVTFPEFIQYVLSEKKYPNEGRVDDHWMPATYMCDPCMFKPHFITKQETFLPDFTFVLNHVGLLNDMRPALEVNQDDYEIENEIDYNFRRYNKSSKFSNCVTKLGLVKRIWKAMKFNGYLQPDEKFPPQMDGKKLNTSTVFEMVRSARERSGINKETKKAIRKQALKSAYKQLSKKQLKTLKELYKTDFEMFGYDSTPPI